MTIQPTPTAAEVLAALATLEAARLSPALKAAVSAMDGTDERAASVDRLANALEALAYAVEADIDELATSHIKAMEYGNALYHRVLAASVSEYANAVQTAHEASGEMVAGVTDLDDEPTDSEAYGEALEGFGLAD